MTHFREILGDSKRPTAALETIDLSAREKADTKLIYNAKRGVPVERDKGGRKREPINTKDLPVVDTTLVPPEVLASALSAIRYGMTEAQISLLREHYLAPSHEIAVDERGRVSPVISYYGRLGGAISRQLGERPKQYHLYWLAVVKPAIGRKPASWQLRPNLAAALELLGWFSPPRPKATSNDSAPVAVEISQILDDLEKQVTESLSDGRAARLARLNVALQMPEKYSVVTTLFRRNPDVVAEAHYRAKGLCEGCRAPAPFTNKLSGRPYLEVHHVVPLSKGGKDTVRNAIALCPNCHRQRHFG